MADAGDLPPPIAFPGELATVLAQLDAVRSSWRAAHPRHHERGAFFPSRQALRRIARELGTALFPLRLGPAELTAANESAFVAASLESTLSQLGAQIDLEQGYADDDGDAATTRAGRIVGTFAAALPAVRRALDRDVEAAYSSDPAARSVDEVLVAYPSFGAIVHHRVAHLLYRLGAPLVARLIAEIAHGETGIDIHPAARIGGGFFIDHGTGVVIGETAVIGERVRLYQGVTLGGDPDLVDAPPGTPRHPILENDVVVHSGTSIVGRVTVGARSRIGGNLWLARDVPPDTRVDAPAPVFGPIAGRKLQGKEKRT